MSVNRVLSQSRMFWETGLISSLLNKEAFALHGDHHYVQEQPQSLQMHRMDSDHRLLLVANKWIVLCMYTLALGHADLPTVHVKPAQPGALLKDFSLCGFRGWMKDLIHGTGDKFDMHKS